MNQLEYYINLMRNQIRERDMLEALFLILETKESMNSNTEDFQSAYKTMLYIANENKINPPFTNEKGFANLYTIISQDISWNILLDFQYNDKFSMSIFYVGKPLINYFESLISNSSKEILIAEGEKFSSSLISLISSNKESNFTITTENNIYSKIFEKVFKNYKNVKLSNSSIYKYEFINAKYDLIFSVPTFGRLLMNEEKSFLCRYYEFAATENLLLHLTETGKLAIVLPAKITFASGDVEKLRNFIQQMYQLEEISLLPTGILPATAIKTYLFIIGTNKNSDDISIRKYKLNNDKLEIKEDTFIMTSELNEYTDWNIDRIFLSQNEDMKKYQNSSTKKIQLGEVAEIFRGKSVVSKNEKGNIGVINISDISELGIDYDSLKYINSEEKKVYPYILEEGDILLSARGTLIKTAVFNKKNYPCIASSNIIVIRPHREKLSGTYLKIFLDSKIGKKTIQGLQQGTTVMNISYRDLATMYIPCPSFEEQLEITKEYNNGLERYKKVITDAEKEWKETIQKLENKF